MDMPRSRSLQLAVTICGAAVAVAAGIFLWKALTRPEDRPQKIAPPALTTLKTHDLVVGTGEPAQEGDVVSFHYKAWLLNEGAPEWKGAEVDNSYSRGQPMSIILGQGQTIPGLDHGMKGMRAGGRRTLLVPSTLGFTSLPANLQEGQDRTDLLIEVELTARQESRP